MALPNAYAQYNNSKVLTASPAELTLMLYDGAIRFCNIAISSINKNDIEKVHKNIIKTQKIIEHLRITLDMKYPVAQDFDNMYLYIEKRLIDANVEKSIEILEEICNHLRSIRDTWKEVMRLNKEKGAGAV